jgi:hypothetical protein
MLWTYADAKTVNGDFVATLSNGKKIQFPLVAGTATLSPAGTGTMSPLGAVTGTTYVAADGSFFLREPDTAQAAGTARVHLRRHPDRPN